MARTKIGKNISLSNDLDAAIKCFLSYCYSKGLSPRTLQFYDERLKQFRRYLSVSGIVVGPKDIDTGLIRSFIDYTRTRYSVATTNHNLNALRILYGFLIEEGWVKDNPAQKVARLKTRRKLIDAVSPDIVRALVKTCDVKTFCGLRDRAIILCLFDTAVRVGELTQSRLSSLNWAEQTLLVSGKTGERVVPFGATVRQTLTSYLARRGDIPNQDFIFTTQFGDAIKRHTVRDILVRRAKAAGLEDAKIHPHAFRHGAALELLRAGASAFHVQRLLGHTTLDMTRTYVDLIDADLKTVHQQCSPTDRLELGKARGMRTRMK